MTREQQLYADLAYVADLAYAGMGDDDVVYECSNIDRKYGITDAYSRCEAIYVEQYES